MFVATGCAEIELRSEAIKQLTDAHRRTAENVAIFQLGVETAMRFAVDVGALSEQEAEGHVKKSWETLLDIAREQSVLLQSQNSVDRFLALVSSAISSGRAHVASLDGDDKPERAAAMGWTIVGRTAALENIWRAQGRRIGWVKDDQIYLDPEASYAEVQALASAQHASLGVTKDTLWKRLVEAGKIVARDPGRNTKRVSTPSGRVPALWLHLADVIDVGDDVNEVPF
jgi:hypothetical protein